MTDGNRSRADCALGQGALRQRAVLSFTPHPFDSLHLIRKQQRTPRNGVPLYFGGADGNRTRVQKPVDMTFSADSHSFKISPRGAPGDRLSGRVALFSMTDARAKYRCMFTTHLTHGRSRSPLRRYGRHENAATRLTPLQQLCCCRLLFKSDGFTGSSCPLRLSYRKVPVETITAPDKRKRRRLFLCYYNKNPKKSQGRTKDFPKGQKKKCAWVSVPPPFSAAAARFDKTIQKACCFVKRILRKNIAKVALFSCEKIHEIVKSP